MELSSVTLQKLRLFQLVYEKGSFNQSAHVLNMSQSAVSQHIKGLESSLGVSLFVRSPKGVQPTPAGVKLYERASQILQLVQQIAVDLTPSDQPQRLTLGATPGAGAYVLPVWLGVFQKQYPHVRVTTQTDLTRETVAAVLDQQVDFGVTLGAVDDLADPLLAEHILAQVDYVVVVPPTHRWAGLGVISAETLTQEPFVARQEGSRSRRWLHKIFGNLAIRAELDSPFATKQAILNGVGISILPTYTVEREVASGDLVALGVDGVTLTRPLLLLWRRDRPFSEAQSSFWQMVMEDSQPPPPSLPHRGRNPSPPPCGRG